MFIPHIGKGEGDRGGERGRRDHDVGGGGEEICGLPSCVHCHLLVPIIPSVHVREREGRRHGRGSGGWRRQR